MFDKIVSVSACPDEVKEALIDQGYPIDGDVKIDTAMGIWAQFHIGDSQWGNDACDHIAHMNSQHSN